jgi:CheY-like chemotaxis protein
VLQPEVLDPAAVVESLAPMLRRLLGEHIELATHRAPDLGRIKVDPGQLEQVIVNLAVNAGDAMPEGGRLTIEVANAELDATYAAQHGQEIQPGPHVLLAVSDTGTGIDPQTQTQIFEPFFTTKEPGKGTGMGLATVYGIVKQSGGAVLVYSEPGRGTTFRIYLPRETEEAGAAADRPAVQPSAGTSTGTILLVEDEPAVRGFARRTLSRLGYTVLEAADGAAAQAQSSAHQGGIDLLLTDVIMPGLLGHQLAEQLAAVRPGLRVLYVSGFTENSVIHQGVPDAGIAFLPKPFSAEALAGAVRRALEAPAR